MTKHSLPKNEQANEWSVVFLDIFPSQWPVDLGPIKPETFKQCGFGGAATLDYGTGQIGLFGPSDLKSLAEKLGAAKTVAGYNCVSFDQAILTGAGMDISRIHWFDLMLGIKEKSRGSYSLASMVKVNFGINCDCPLKLHRDQTLKQNQIWLLQKAVNGVNNMARLFTRVIETSELMVPNRINSELRPVKLNWRKI